MRGGSKSKRGGHIAEGTWRRSGLDLEDARVALVKEKQGELDRIESRHDDLIREKFHLERFVTLVSYNPDEAKADNSDVWQQWKQSSQHDLLGSSSGRTTRRAHHTRVEALRGSQSVVPTPSAPKLAASSAFWDIVSPQKAKGKTKARATAAPAPVPMPVMPKAKGRMHAEVVLPSHPLSRHLRRDLARSDDEPAMPPRKRRKTDDTPQTPRTPRTRPVPSSPAPSTPPSRRKRVRVSEPAPAITSSGNLKRVKLIVRPPQAIYSHPAQRPPEPRFDRSIPALLASYARLEDDGPDLDDDMLNKAAREDAGLLERVSAMRQKGRMLLSAADAEVAVETVKAALAESETPTSPRGVWDHTLEDVRRYAERSDYSSVQVAAAIAGKIRTYWEAHAVKEGKARLQEEKRLRALAKATGRMVLKQWERAVWYVREQERLAREAEEARRGREHLDKILDQSGQILQSQHFDLSRAARPRSESADVEVDSDDEEGTVMYDSDEADDSQVNSVEDPVRASLRDSDEEDEQTLALLGASVLPPGDLSDDERYLADAVSTSSDLVATPAADDVAEPGFAGSPPFSGVHSPHKYMLNDDHPSLVDPLVFSTEKLDAENALVPLRSPPQTVPVSSVGDFAENSPSLNRTLANSEATALTATPGHVPTGFGDGVIPSVATVEISIGDPDDDLVQDEEEEREEEDEDEDEFNARIPRYLHPYAVAPVSWDPNSKVAQPSLLRGVLRPYQQSGLEWLASLHVQNLNGILADEMGLGKTIQTIALLAHLACDRGIWGPHLIVVPTSVLLNWEMEFKKFLPGFKVLAYHGPRKRRRELRQGWYNKYSFNVCITSYTLASRDAHVFKRKPWYYMILDEAHMIKNFRSQRWNILLMFRSFRRLLLTGTPLQNNLTELWALLQFLMTGTNFANLKEFAEWFANPLEKAIEQGGVLDDETRQRVSKLHTVLRPYLLRRLKRDVEKELPSKYEHLVLCPLSKRQRFLYDEFMSRAQTRNDLSSGVYQKIANILMQLRKVCNHPDLFEERPIITSFTMSRSAVADFEIKELLVRKRLLQEDDAQHVNLGFLGLNFSDTQNRSLITAQSIHRLDGTSFLPSSAEMPGEPPPHDSRTIVGFTKFKEYRQRVAQATHWERIRYINRQRCAVSPVISSELITLVRHFSKPILPGLALDRRRNYLTTVDALHRTVKTYQERAEEITPILERFAFATPAAVARDLPRHALAEAGPHIAELAANIAFDNVLHRSAVRLQLAFPDPSLLQYDCGKLQRLAALLRERKAGGHRVLIFTQMTRILDVLERFLNFHGYLYLRLDGGTKIEDRQYITERFNSDPKMFCFIASSRSGGVGINLTGADTVIFYDSDFNPQMDRQCEDRAHRIGQIRDVHVYRFISQHTVEEAMLRKADQKRSLDDLVIQKGGFDWRALFGDDGNGLMSKSFDGFARALEEFVDDEDAAAAKIAEHEEGELEGADREEFDGEDGARSGEATPKLIALEGENAQVQSGDDAHAETNVKEIDQSEGGGEGGDELGGTTVEYMVSFIEFDYEHFNVWQIRAS